MKNKTEKLENYFQNNQLDDALKVIQNDIDNSTAGETAYFWLGKIHYKRQEWGEAINAFNKVLEINPDNKEAQSQIDMANSILGYFTPDMFNP